MRIRHFDPDDRLPRQRRHNTQADGFERQGQVVGQIDDAGNLRPRRGLEFIHRHDRTRSHLRHPPVDRKTFQRLGQDFRLQFQLIIAQAGQWTGRITQQFLGIRQDIPVGHGGTGRNGCGRFVRRHHTFFHFHRRLNLGGNHRHRNLFHRFSHHLHFATKVLLLDLARSTRFLLTNSLRLSLFRFSRPLWQPPRHPLARGQPPIRKSLQEDRQRQRHGKQQRHRQAGKYHNMRPGRGEITPEPIGQHLTDDATGQTAIDPSTGNRGDRRHFQMQQRAQEEHRRHAAAGVP